MAMKPPVESEEVLPLSSNISPPTPEPLVPTDNAIPPALPSTARPVLIKTKPLSP